MTDKIYGLPTCFEAQRPSVGDHVEVRHHPNPEDETEGYGPTYVMHMPDDTGITCVGVWKPGADGIWDTGEWGEPEEVTGTVVEVRVENRTPEQLAELSPDVRAAAERGELPEPVWVAVRPD
ncbi:MAG: hypothetical protein ACRYG8_03435 [Janthinobacterium lividum]